jgi:hypothetical protein
MTDRTPQNHVHRSLKDIHKERLASAEREGVKYTTRHYLAVPIYEGYVPKYLGIQSKFETYN